MNKNQSSLTAEGIAYARAWESKKPAGERICYDPLAHYFVSPLFNFVGSLFFGYKYKTSPGVTEFLIVRCRYMDDYLASCIDNGLEQLVILGAGFDSRAYRFDKLKGQVRVFEVDHPATQRVKILKMKKILGEIPAYVTYVPVDFTEYTLEKQLSDSGYKKNLKTLFIWEGVTYYIPADAVNDTLDFVAHNSGAGSSIIFDYTYTSVVDGTFKKSEIVSMKRSRSISGEGIIFGIKERTIEEFLTQRSFCQIKNATSEDLTRLYCTGVNKNRFVTPGYSIVHAVVKIVEPDRNK